MRASGPHAGDEHTGYLAGDHVIRHAIADGVAVVGGWEEVQ